MTEPRLRGPGRRPGEAAAAEHPALDGRHRRSQRSRARILDAVARAIADAETVLTPERVAAGAGVSISTIFRHFHDMEGLAAAMRERVAQRVMPYFTAGPFEGDARTRLRELLRRRSAIFEIVGPLRRASLRQPRRPQGGRREDERFRNAMWAQMMAALELELRNDAELAQIVDTLLSLGAWTHLRIEEALGVDAAVALVERAVLAQLGIRAGRR